MKNEVLVKDDTYWFVHNLFITNHSHVEVDLRYYYIKPSAFNSMICRMRAVLLQIRLTKANETKHT
jgi:hypothetical protein